ncbi:DUF2809 domain-containing protein [Chamaesiphon sp. VAR_48_metabat_403]|uniref:ribosomal maturation YjgA family protein n=1 Tax=Chamaesiphon sp. VAR_48_metabat_403 TaxID=2964700 RepID=UPI00286E0F53|nr:DUF2809 domain-containing protein [Chamaesiphon sp. VAR_48_metabat_403]
MLVFNKRYACYTIGLFLVEVFIAVFINDSFIRPFIGDVLVVILIYCLVRTFWKTRYHTAALSVLAFACTIEILQYFKLVNFLGLEKYKIIAIAIGSTFDWKDIIAYILGTMTVLGLESKRSKN